jgi:uncharacterized coiled-coil protein SlyX
MLKTTVRAWLLLCPVLIAGCLNGLGKPAAPPASPATRPADASALARQVKDLQDELAALKRENAILAAREQELLGRDRALSKELIDLQFAGVQQARTIEALSSAPAERDRYQKQVEELTEEVARLRQQVLALGGKLPTPATATAPASMPSTLPATMPSTTPQDEPSVGDASWP